MASSTTKSTAQICYFIVRLMLIINICIADNETNISTSSPSSVTEIVVFDETINIEYKFMKLTAQNINKVMQNQSFIIQILDAAYIELSQFYADSKAEELKIFQYEITIRNPETDVIDNSENATAIIETYVDYHESSVGQTLQFITQKRAFITTVQPFLTEPDIFDNQDVIFKVRIIPPVVVIEASSFDYVLWGLLSFMIGMTLLALVAYINNKRPTASIDDSDWTVPLSLGLQIFDFISDLNLTLEILLELGTGGAKGVDAALLLVSGIGSLAFCLIPYCMNLSMAVKIKEFISGNHTAMVFFEQRSAIFILVTVFCGSTYSALALLSSRLFGLDLFNSGLTKYELKSLSRIKVFGSVLAENVPQLGCQFLYALYLGGAPSANTLLSFCASVLSIIFAVLGYVINGQSDDTFVTQYDLEMKKKNKKPLIAEEKHLILRNKERKLRWGKQIALGLKLPRSAIELGFVTLTHTGCVLHMVHYVFTSELDDMMQARGSQTMHSLDQLAKIFTSKLYEKNMKPIIKCFNDQFQFESPIMNVQYVESFGYNTLLKASKRNVLDNVDLEDEDSYSEQCEKDQELGGQMKELLRDTHKNDINLKEIKESLIDKGFQERQIISWFSLFKLDQKQINQLKQETNDVEQDVKVEINDIDGDGNDGDETTGVDDKKEDNNNNSNDNEDDGDITTGVDGGTTTTVALKGEDQENDKNDNDEDEINESDLDDLALDVLKTVRGSKRMDEYKKEVKVDRNDGKNDDNKDDDHDDEHEELDDLIEDIIEINSPKNVINSVSTEIISEMMHVTNKK